MKKEKLDELLKDDFTGAVKAIKVKPIRSRTKYEDTITEKLDPLNEYEVNNHPVFDKIERKDFPIVEVTKDTNGNETGTRITGYRATNRIAIALEELIVGRAAAFLCGLPVKYQCTPKEGAETRMWEAFKHVNEKNKLDFKNLGLLKQRMSELEVAEIWYYEELSDGDDYWEDVDVKGKKAPRIFIASPSLKDTLWPVWDDKGVLLALGREYTVMEEEEVKHFDVYTPDGVYEGTEGGGKWEVNFVKSETGKTEVIYHYQAKPEWDNARPHIRRLEKLASNHADSNDKTMSPILMVVGEDVELPKGETQRAIRGSIGADAKYVTADNAPASLELEVKNLWKYTFETTNTVDISPETVQGIGQISGIALELLFLPAMLKAAEHAGTFGECIQRRINLIKRMLVVVDPTLKEGMSVKITPTFDFFLPKDLEGIISYLTTAKQGGILSQETAVNNLAGVMGGDGKTELQKVQAEANSAEALNREQNEEAA